MVSGSRGDLIWCKQLLVFITQLVYAFDLLNFAQLGDRFVSLPCYLVYRVLPVSTEGHFFLKICCRDLRVLHLLYFYFVLASQDRMRNQEDAEWLEEVLNKYSACKWKALKPNFDSQNWPDFLFTLATFREYQVLLNANSQRTRFLEIGHFQRKKTGPLFSFRRGGKTNRYSNN